MAIDKSEGTIAFVVPLTEETQSFMTKVQEEYEKKFQSSPLTKAPS
jgi:hypothetical protein